MSYRNARVLVVDDVADNRDLLARRLARLGVGHVAQAEDGQAALAAIADGQFDLVLLDIMMPGLDGFGVLAALRDQGVLHELPVVVISAIGEMEAVVRCIGLGAEDFLPKPFDPVLLRARVSAVLDKQAMRLAMRRELERKRRELGEARGLQRALLPAAVEEPGLRADVLLESAREIGGDLVDMFRLGDGRLVLILGDVSDKGAAAAFFMARCHAVLRGLAARPDAASLFDDPAEVVRQANLALSQHNDACMFITLWLGVLEPASGAIRHLRAGAVAPWRWSATAGLERWDASGGLPLGLVEGALYRATQSVLAPGDALLAVTDGVTEAENAELVQFGEAATAAWFAGAAADGAAPAPALAALLAAVRAHEAGTEATDDTAALFLRMAS